MKKRQNNWMSDVHELFDGDCKIFTSNKSNGVYQIQLWLSEEGKTYRRSLRTKHLETALQKGKEKYMDITARVNWGSRYFQMMSRQLRENFLIGKTKMSSQEQSSRED